MLLTAYSGDSRVPLAGVLKYTEQLKNAIHTHFTVQPKSGTCIYTLSYVETGLPIVDYVGAYVRSRPFRCNFCIIGGFNSSGSAPSSRVSVHVWRGSSRRTAACRGKLLTAFEVHNQSIA